MRRNDEATRAMPRPEAARGVAPSADDARGTWRVLWPYIVIPPLVVAAGVAWLWFGAEGGFVEAGRYTLS